MVNSNGCRKKCFVRPIMYSLFFLMNVYYTCGNCDIKYVFKTSGQLLESTPSKFESQNFANYYNILPQPFIRYRTTANCDAVWFWYCISTALQAVTTYCTLPKLLFFWTILYHSNWRSCILLVLQKNIFIRFQKMKNSIFLHPENQIIYRVFNLKDITSKK